MKRSFFIIFMVVSVVMATTANAGTRKKAKAVSTSHHVTKNKLKKPVSPSFAESGLAEARLVEVYQLAAQARLSEALTKVESLVHDYPHFQLAQLAYGDLLSARSGPLRTIGDVPASLRKAGAVALAELLGESQMRLKALRERPANGAVPSQFLALSALNKHAIAIDVSLSRLYLFENRPSGLTLVGDYYVSVGKSGSEKAAEGDLRTPLGVYFITSNLDPRQLKDFYGAGALPINYPNELDSKRGKTGKGIWLHGTPPGQFSRAPQATDGCVVLANPDLSHLIRTVEVRTTPVVISQRLNWVMPNSSRSESKPFEAALMAWQSAKSSGNVDRVLSFYSQDFNSNGKTLSQWTPALRSELDKIRGRAIELKNLSLLRWTDSTDTMVVTFGEVADGVRAGRTKRQYWVRQGSQWKIFYEGVIG